MFRATRLRDVILCQRIECRIIFRFFVFSRISFGYCAILSQPVAEFVFTVMPTLQCCVHGPLCIIETYHFTYQHNTETFSIVCTGRRFPPRVNREQHLPILTYCEAIKVIDGGGVGYSWE
jgi:hypothetical protein